MLDAEQFEFSAIRRMISALNAITMLFPISLVFIARKTLFKRKVIIGIAMIIPTHENILEGFLIATRNSVPRAATRLL